LLSIKPADGLVVARVDSQLFSQSNQPGSIAADPADTSLIRIEIEGWVCVAMFMFFGLQAPCAVLIIAKSLYRCSLP
jgi:hypothetical protein